MKALLISGDTQQTKEWDINTILRPEPTKDDLISILIDQEWFDTTSKCGLSYGQIKELDQYSFR